MRQQRGKVFISYRADDSAPTAALLDEQLQKRIGRDRVFFAPVMKPGAVFPQQLRDELDRTTVLVAVIGQGWLAGDKWNRRRIDFEDDWVRIEVAYALARPEVTVIPFLLPDASLPSLADASVLPDVLQPLTGLHSVRQTQKWEIPSVLIEGVAGQIESSLRTSRAAGVSGVDATVAVVHCGVNVELLDVVLRVLPGRPSMHAAAGVAGPHMLLESGILTCQAAVVFLDREALTSVFVEQRAQVLAWRAALGMPLVAVLLDDVRPSDLASSSIGYLADSQVVDGSTVESEGAADAVARQVEDYLAGALRNRVFTYRSDPATKWASDVIDILQDLRDSSLPELAERLHIPGAMFDAAPDQRSVLAAALFSADLEAAYDFLRNARELLHRAGAPRAKRRALAAQAIPIWVDFDTGRTILRASDLPAGRRLCGVRLSLLEWAEHATKRASAGALDYHSVRVPSVAGEHILAELRSRYVETLRQCLFYETSVPGTIDSTLMHKAVFVILDAKNLAPMHVRELLKVLADEFPQFTFVLVSDQLNAHLYPSISVADPLSDKQPNAVASYVWHTKALMELDRDPHA